MLERRGNVDLIAALRKRHRVSLNTHGQRPTVAVYLQNGVGKTASSSSGGRGEPASRTSAHFQRTPSAYGSRARGRHRHIRRFAKWASKVYLGGADRRHRRSAHFSTAGCSASSRCDRISCGWPRPEAGRRWKSAFSKGPHSVARAAAGRSGIYYHRTGGQTEFTGCGQLQP